MNPAGTEPRTRSTVLDRATLVVRSLLAIGFAASGVMMLTGLGGLGDLVDAIGAGPWLRYVIGAAQLAGAVGLMITPLAGMAAIGLLLVMVGAVATEISLGTPPVAALVVLTLLAFIAWRLKTRTLRTLQQARAWARRRRPPA